MNVNRVQRSNQLFDQYVGAREVVIASGFDAEVDWQFHVDFSASSEQDFLREGAWVILSSGMRESVVREKFEAISEAFRGFSSAIEIVENYCLCRWNALRTFNHTKKIDAILSMAMRVAVDGFQAVKQSTKHYGVDYLQSFDFIGPATSYHLAKNLGLNVSKPDRHLSRVAEAAGFDSVQHLCEEISIATGDPIAVVDLVIWRFATLRSDYRNWFASDVVH